MNASRNRRPVWLGIGLFVVSLSWPLDGWMLRVRAEDGSRALVAQAETPQPAVSPPANNPNPVLLGPGANPQEVMILQQELTQLGLYTGPVEGDYNAETQAAVKAFQTSNNLAATGLLDSQTWERMTTPQLFSGESPPAPTPEMPSLFPSSAGDTAASPANQATPNPEPTPQASTAAEPQAQSRLAHWRWVVPLIGLGSVGGIGWIWARRRGRTPGTSTPTDDFTSESTHDAYPIPTNGQTNGAHSAIASPRHAPDSADSGMATHTVQATPTNPSPSDANSKPQPTQATSTSASTSAVSSPRTGASSTPADPARLPSVNIVETLVRELESTDAAVRQQAIWELGQRGNSTAIQPLVNSLLGADSYEKSLIFAALGEIGQRSFQPMKHALVLGLRDPSPEVRKNAIRDLSRLYGGIGQIRPMLLHAAQDPDPEVQAIAQWALGQTTEMPTSRRLDAAAPAPPALDERQPPTP